MQYASLTRGMDPPNYCLTFWLVFQILITFGFIY